MNTLIVEESDVKAVYAHERRFKYITVKGWPVLVQKALA